jgi:hypothetical protein
MVSGAKREVYRVVVVDAESRFLTRKEREFGMTRVFMGSRITGERQRGGEKRHRNGVENLGNRRE